MASSIRFRPSLKEVQVSLGRRLRQLADLSVPNQQIAVFLDSWVQRNFRSQGGSVGRWTPFKRGGRRLRGGGFDSSAKLLQDTGALRASFRPFWDRKKVGISSDISYSIFHEEGTRHLPRRRMLPEQEDVLPDILRIYDRHLSRLSRKGLWT